MAREQIGRVLRTRMMSLLLRVRRGDLLKRAYRFILNGLVNANQILGEEVFRTEDWRVIGEYVYDDEGGRHQAFYSPVKDVAIFGETIKAHERIQVEQSLKYSQAAATKLWNTAGLTEVDKWELDDEYGKSILGFVLYHHYPRFPGEPLLFLSPATAAAGKSYDAPRMAGNQTSTRDPLLF